MAAAPDTAHPDWLCFEDAAGPLRCRGRWLLAPVMHDEGVTAAVWEDAAGALVVEELDVEGADLVFDRQDSGCLSYRVEARGRRWFVKTARSAEAARSLNRRCSSMQQFTIR